MIMKHFFFKKKKKDVQGNWFLSKAGIPIGQITFNDNWYVGKVCQIANFHFNFPTHSSHSSISHNFAGLVWKSHPVTQSLKALYLELE